MIIKKIGLYCLIVNLLSGASYIEEECLSMTSPSMLEVMPKNERELAIWTKSNLYKEIQPFLLLIDSNIDQRSDLINFLTSLSNLNIENLNSEKLINNIYSISQ